MVTAIELAVPWEDEEEGSWYQLGHIDKTVFLQGLAEHQFSCEYLLEEDATIEAMATDEVEHIWMQWATAKDCDECEFDEWPGRCPEGDWCFFWSVEASAEFKTPFTRWDSMRGMP